MKLFDKKFKVKIEHFSNCKYAIYYCNYRIIPIWSELCFWFEQGHPGGTQCWSIELFDIKEAEDIAKNLKSMDDIDNYYKPHIENAKKWLKEEKEYWQKNMPYTSKIV
jgi:hypothetical protein